MEENSKCYGANRLLCLHYLNVAMRKTLSECLQICGHNTRYGKWRSETVTLEC